MGNTQPGECNGAICYKCGKSLPAMKNFTYLKQEIHYGRDTHVFFDGVYYRFVDHPDGHRCADCFWKPLHDQQRQEREQIAEQRRQEELNRQREEERAEMERTAEEQRKQLELERRIESETRERKKESCKKMAEFNNMVNVWAAEERLSRREAMTATTEVSDSTLADTSAVYQENETQIEDFDTVGMHDRRSLSELCEADQFQFSKDNLLRLVNLATEMDRDAEWFLIRLAQENTEQLFSVFRELLFQDWIEETVNRISQTGPELNEAKGERMSFPDRKVLNWIQIFFMDLLRSYLEEEDEYGDTTEHEISDLYPFTNLMNTWDILRCNITDCKGSIQFTRALYLLVAENDFYDDSILLDKFYCWQKHEFLDYNVATVKFLERLIRAADLITDSGDRGPSTCSWTGRAAELLINICTPGSPSGFSYKEMLARLVNTGVWYPSDIADVLPNILQHYDPSDCYLPRVLEYIAAYKIQLMNSINEWESLANMFENGLDSSKMLHCLKKRTEQEKDKTLCEILDEIAEEDLSPLADLTNINCIVQVALDELPKYGYPEVLTGWRVENFSNWADDLKHSQQQPLSQNSLTQSLITLCCAIKQVKGYWPRVTQMVSWCFLMTKNHNKGRLIQMLTGEGKSCVITMVATTLACLHKTVDIVTSSPILASRDAEEWRSFYSVFSLKATHNTSNSSDKERFQCYQSKIVYGTVGGFASDILRQEFQLKDVRGTRGFNAVIVDEVDFMLLDQGVQFTYLSESYAGLRHLQPILAVVWNAATQYKPVGTLDGNVFYTGPVRPFYNAAYDVISSNDCNIETYVQLLAMGESEGVLAVGFKDKIEENEHSLDALKAVLSEVTVDTVIEFLDKVSEYVPCIFHSYTLNEDGVIVATRDVDENVEGVTHIPILVAEHGMCMVLQNDEIFLKRMIIDNIGTHISYENTSKAPAVLDIPQSQSNTDVLEVPQNLKEFVNSKLPVWVENSFKATRMLEGREYIIKSGQIVPIDYRSTGVVETSKKWSDGLQQFLEMKHRLTISDLSLVTNFMSNITFFLRYGCNVYGVTGTLGSKGDRDFLQRQFCVDLCYMPTSLRRKLYECGGVVCEDDSEWMDKVCEKVKAEVTNTNGRLGRAALVICEDITKANTVYEALKKRVTDKIILYTRSDRSESEIMNHTFTLGTVIVSTNLAGRGTDISLTKQICESGGLHVLVTFLPLNTRVEEQAFGRAGRKGQPGSAEIVINRSHLSADTRQLKCLKSLRTYRENKQKNTIKLTELVDVKECLLKENLFDLYCRLITRVQNMAVFNPSTKDRKYTKKKNIEKTEKENMVTSIHEYWGMWLQMQTDRIKSLEKEALIADLNSCISDALKTVEKRYSPTNNIYHVIYYGNNRIMMEKYEDASTLFNKAITINEKFATIAHYNKAYCILKCEKEEYLGETIKELELAQKKLQAYRDEVVLVKQLVDLSWSVKMPSTEGEDTDCRENEVNKSIETRLQLLKCVEEHIEKSLTKLKELQEGGHDADIDVTSIFDLVHERDTMVEKEICQLWKQGLVFTFSVKKKVRFSWTALFVTILGVAQVVAGVAVLSLTMGALVNVGVGLIAEGVSDIIDSCIGMYKGEFDLKSWAVGKGVSLAISMVAFSCAKVATKGFRPALSAVKKGLKEVKAFSTVISKNVSFTGKKMVMTTAMKKGMKKAAKYAVKETTEQIIMKGVNHLEDVLIDGLMNRVEEVLLGEIRRCMRRDFKSSTLRAQVDRLLFNTFSGQPPHALDVEPLLRDLSKIGNQVVNPFVSDLTLRGHITQGVNSVVKRVETEMKRTKNNKYLTVFKFIKKVHTAYEVCDATGKLLTLTTQYNQRLTHELEKICDKLDVNEYDTYDIPNVENIYERVVEIFSDILSKTVKLVFHHQIASHAINKARSSVNGIVNKFVSTKLKTSDTLQEISSLAAQRFAAHSSTTNKGSATDTRLINSYIKDNLNAESPGSVTDSRVLSEKLGKNIEVYEMTNGGLKKNIVVGSNSTDQSPIKVLYHRPTSEYPEGHYDAIVNGKVVPIANKDKSCLFHAIAKTLHPHANGTTLQSHAGHLKETIRNELSENPRKWTDFISNAAWAKNLKGGYESMQIGAGTKCSKPKSNQVKKKAMVKKSKKAKTMKIPKIDSDVINRYQIGKVGEYSAQQYAKKLQREKGKQGNVKTNLDHQPAFSCIHQSMTDEPSKLAIEMAAATGLFGSDDKNPMILQGGHGKPLIVNTVLQDHHKHYLTTGSSAEANAVRKEITKRIQQDDPVGMFKQTFVASTLSFVKSVNDDNLTKVNKLIKQSGPNPSEALLQKQKKIMTKFDKIPTITDANRRAQYEGLGFADTFNKWHAEYLSDIMTPKQVGEVRTWIKDEGYRNADDPAFKHLRDVCKSV